VQKLNTKGLVDAQKLSTRGRVDAQKIMDKDGAKHRCKDDVQNTEGRR